MADAKPVTTFRFDEATRAELDRIQEELGKNTWQQTINAIIMDYMRMVVRLRMANQANDLLERKAIDIDRRLVLFRKHFMDILQIEEPRRRQEQPKPLSSRDAQDGDDDDDDDNDL